MSVDLICPGCRTRNGDRLELRTVERNTAGDLLICACGRRYPVVDGVPILLRDPTHFLVNEIAGVVERDLAPEVAAALVETGPDDAPYPRLVEHLSIYLDAHWGDRAAPPPDGPPFAPAQTPDRTSIGTEAPAAPSQAGGDGIRPLLARVAARASSRVALAVELGSSVGRFVAELAAGADHVVGVELSFGAVRRARRLLAGERVAYARRTIGRHYTPASAAAGDRAVAADRVTLVCSDALDPPLVPGVFGRVAALNLLDSVRHPRLLLSVIDGLCAPGGEILVSCPYAWQSGVVEDAERFGGADPAGALVRILREGEGLGGRYAIEDEAELAWTLRRDARSAVAYRIHYVRARKQ
jgi:uncharacterized protein YbaR (Trm112 family)/SAM-dependent methyltransferase